MAVRLRSFDVRTDFKAISDFLVQNHVPGNRDGNWLQPIWEYACTHSQFDESSRGRIGVWEKGGQIVGVVTFESHLGEAFFSTHASYQHLKPEMLTYAEEHLTGTEDNGVRYVNVFVNDFDLAFEQVVKTRGYQKHSHRHRPMSTFEIPASFPHIALPEGFRLKSLADENDLRKVQRVLHRGFDHPGEPPQEGLEGIRKMQSSPNFRKDITVVVQAPTGDFVSYCGMWYDEVNHYCYVEPVATDPDYRRRGLGRAAVLEGIRRCGELGATVAYAGTDKPFYLSFGFRKQFTTNCWRKSFVRRGTLHTFGGCDRIAERGG